MKYCPGCGALCDDSAAFCMSCGTKLSGTAPEQPADNSYQTEATYNPDLSHAPVPPATPAIGVLKNVASSPLFIVSVAAFTLALVFKLVNVFTVSIALGAIFDFLKAVAYDIDFYGLYSAVTYIEEYTNEFFYIINSVNISAALFGMILSILIAVGLWMTFAAGANKRDSGFSTTGLSIIKVINTISLVFACIGYGLLLLFMIALGTLAATAAMVGYAAAFFFMILLFAAPIAVLSIMYYVKINKTIDSAKYTALTGNGSIYASAYVSVLCFIGAFLNLFSIFTAFGAAGKLSVICSTAALFCFGVLIFTYRSRMQVLAYTPMPLSGLADESDFSN